MALTKTQFSKYIREFDFRGLFNDMGWNNDKTIQSIIIEEMTFILSSVAEKSGFKILLCSACDNGKVPESHLRKKIETKVTKLFQEHLIIFCDNDKNQQIWQLVVRQSGKNSKMTETHYNVSQDPELLYQKASGLFFELDEEEKITIVDVTQRVAENFHQNIEKVTKQFYERFKKEHTRFLTFIHNIDDKINQDWYASLMLNRLMFCYFIQKRGFLDNNLNYLRDKLREYQIRRGKNKFFSFYRHFLLILFHDGLGKPNHSNELNNEIGIIPYLNGGLFDEHTLENLYNHIEIEDKAFEHIFDFFDEYEWHLDIRPSSSGKDINPDVIGYIFEKYINDRADMGAYYTKEDITEYISINSIIPFLFEETRRQYPTAFENDRELWSLVRESGDKFIHEEIKYGIKSESFYQDLPEEIALGLNPNQKKLSEKRINWNDDAPNDIALSTETWRNLIDRRKQYEELRRKIENSEITCIHDFISNNLDLKQFAQDVIESISDEKFIEHFFKSVQGIKILDPTCGSGAFLFAALNVLEPLYYVCLQRIHNFLTESSSNNTFFKEIEAEIISPKHSDIKYYIYKSIILRNLYGVDIMNEAVETAKLRLFLKLVATIDADYSKPNLGIEPLPDIDFNIRVGNSLVGFASVKDLRTGSIDFQKDEDKILKQMQNVSSAFVDFKERQLSNDTNESKTFKSFKENYQKQLIELKNKLNVSYYNAFGDNKIKFDDWLEKYTPFHWFAEFYDIIHTSGGFDVIIGNPPYLELRQINYEPKQLRTYTTGAVHNMCIERSIQILKKNGSISMIVPLALVCTQRMVMVQNMLESNRTTWYSNFAWRPAKLFENVNRALTIFISNATNNEEVYVTKYIKWTSETRKHLFPSIKYLNWNKKRSSFWIPKLDSKVEYGILEKVLACDSSIAHIVSNNSLNRIYYRTTGGLYWKIFTNYSPKFFLNGKEGKSSRETYFSVAEKDYTTLSVGLLSSNLFWWWYTITSNLRDLNPIDIQSFKFPSKILEDKLLLTISNNYLENLTKNSTMLTRIQKQTGETKTQSFKVKLSKPIIDKIDAQLAKHYFFSEEELDFIINYDIKYRMGRISDNEDDE